MQVWINPSIFREYDIRGVVGEDITPEVAETIARAYATFLRRKSTLDAGPRTLDARGTPDACHRRPGQP